MKGHNKFGVIAALVTLISLFLPVVNVSHDSYLVINDGTGKLIFILLIVLTMLFYCAVTKLYTQILVSLILGILLFHYYNFFSWLSYQHDWWVAIMVAFNRKAPNFFQYAHAVHAYFQWGAFIHIAACAAIFIAAFKKGDSKNKKLVASNKALFEA